jgi:hypothetical protein
MATIIVPTACDTAPYPAPWIAPELNSPPSTSPKILRLMRHTDSGEHLQAPVVVTATDHWCGYRPERIGALADQATCSSGIA